MKDLEKRKE